MSLQPKPPRLKELYEINKGQNNAGIVVLLENATGKKFVRKQIKTSERKSTMLEVAAMKKLLGFPGAVRVLHLVRSSGWDEEATELLDGIYMQYCGAYLKYSGQSDGKEVHSIKDLQPELLGKHCYPELFVFHVYEALLTYLCFTHLGIRDVAIGDVDKNWKPLFHTDLHTGNQFLNASDIDAQKEYPRIVVGDFGLATHVHDKVSSSQDVARVANSLYQLCHAQADPKQCLQVDEWRDVIGSTEIWKYSEELRALVVAFEEVDDVSSRLLTLAREVVQKKSELLESGQLKFVSLELMVAPS